jgi:hypothetical protein
MSEKLLWKFVFVALTVSQPARHVLRQGGGRLLTPANGPWDEGRDFIVVPQDSNARLLIDFKSLDLLDPLPL